jgi:hypothetical protein
MLELLLVNTRTLLRFHRRNRLLIGFGLVMLTIFLLSFVPALLFETTSSRFEMLRNLASQMNSFALVLVPALGLLAVSSHVAARNVKLVVTKPCPPEVWLGAVFLSAILVALAIHAAMALFTAALSLWWKVPYQSGFLFIAIEGFFSSVVLLSFLTALAMAMHPVIAVITVLFFNESMFYQLKFVVAAAQRSGEQKGLLAAEVACDTVYQLLPMLDPLGQRVEALRASLRVSGHDWLLLALAGLYALLATAFFFVGSSWLLRRKSLA